MIADAKDADMAFGVRCARTPQLSCRKPGVRHAAFSPEIWSREEYGYRNLPEFLDIIREVTHRGLIDIMLMSAYVNEQLTIKEGLFKNSHVTPAARANDTTDVWAVRHGCYTREPVQTFRSASIDHIPMRKAQNVNGMAMKSPAQTSGCIPSHSSTISIKTVLRSRPLKNFSKKRNVKVPLLPRVVFDPNVD